MLSRENFLKTFFILAGLVAAVFVLLPQSGVFASAEVGTIDDSYKYAWADRAGWLNFDAQQGAIFVTDTGLTGYVWSEVFGWINLSPPGSGVVNNGEGTLSGYAWGENTGWIDFSAVGIDSLGRFTGTATGDIIGTINFVCDNCFVKTDWRPLSQRGGGGLVPGGGGGGGGGGEGGGGGGGGGEETSVLDTEAPKIEITYIKEKYNPAEDVLIGGITEGGIEVFLYLDDYYSSFETDASGEWLISLGKLALGKHKVELIPKDQAGNSGAPLTVEFEVSEDVPAPEEYQQPEFWQWWQSIMDKQSILEKIKQGLKLLIPKFLRPEEIKKGPKIISRVPLKTPLAFLKKWILLPEEPIRRFALSPLPKELKSLAQKFPKLQKTFEEVGILKITDVGKIKGTNFKLPGLTETLGLARTEISPGKFSALKGVPIAKLSVQAKQQIPSEIVFAKTGGELIDFNIALSINEKGKNQQTIKTIVGKPLELVVKPDRPAKRVVGYIVFKQKKPKEASYKVPLNVFAASLMFDAPVLSEEQKEPIDIENVLVLVEFEYIDTGNGVWTATVPAPIIDGEYEIITVMEYEDEKLAPKEIRLITVVDPEGYIYEKEGIRETRIAGAIAQLYWLNPNSPTGEKQYELWPAGEYQQENPQTTDVRGTYSFLVPEGFYYIKVDAPGYMSYDGKPFQVTEGSGVHINIELKTKYWWLKIADWKTALLIAVILLLLYNFYRDRRRELVDKLAARKILDREAIEKELREKIEKEIQEREAIKAHEKELELIEAEENKIDQTNK